MITIIVGSFFRGDSSLQYKQLFTVFPLVLANFWQHILPEASVKTWNTPSQFIDLDQSSLSFR
jgi:hypothetical protein